MYIISILYKNVKSLLFGVNVFFSMIYVENHKNMFSVKYAYFLSCKQTNVRFACLQLACDLQIVFECANISKRKEST